MHSYQINNNNNFISRNWLWDPVQLQIMMPLYQDNVLLSSYSSVILQSWTHCHLVVDQLFSTFRHILRTKLSVSINPIDDRWSSAKNDTKSPYTSVQQNDDVTRYTYIRGGGMTAEEPVLVWSSSVPWFSSQISYSVANWASESQPWPIHRSCWNRSLKSSTGEKFSSAKPTIHT